MDEKKYKKLVTIIVILILIIISMVGYIVYDVVTGSNNNVSKGNNYEEVTEKDYDLAKAKQLLDNIGYDSFLGIAKESKIESLKIQIAFDNTLAKGKTATCDSIYSDLPNAKKTEDGYNVTLSDDYEHYEDDFECYESVQVISYNDINDTYQKLFGRGKTIPKKDFSFSHCYNYYDYIESLDAFVSLLPPIMDGCYDAEIFEFELGLYAVNVIKTAKIKDKELTVEVARAILEQNDNEEYELKTGDKKVTFESSEVEKEGFDKEFFNQYSQYMQNYRFVFELEDNNYIFKSLSKD